MWDCRKNGRDLMFILLLLAIGKVNLTNQLGQKMNMVNEFNEKRKHNNTKTRFLYNDILLTDITVPTSTTSSLSSSPSSLRDQSYTFNHNKYNGNNHHQHLKKDINYRYNHYRHGRSSHHHTKTLSRQNSQILFIPTHHSRNHKNMNVRPLGNKPTKKRTSNLVTTSELPSYLVVDSFHSTNLQRLNNIIGFDTPHGIKISSDNHGSHIMAKMSPHETKSLRIMRRDTSNLLEKQTKYTIQNNLTWPVKRIAEISGDIVIGGLHMVHERENTKICGPIMPQGGLQAAEVMLYTVDKINEQRVMPGGLKLGAHVLDDCDTDTYGLQQAVDFIKGKPFGP